MTPTTKSEWMVVRHHAGRQGLVIGCVIAASYTIIAVLYLVIDSVPTFGWKGSVGLLTLLIPAIVFALLPGAILGFLTGHLLGIIHERLHANLSLLKAAFIGIALAATGAVLLLVIAWQVSQLTFNHLPISFWDWLWMYQYDIDKLIFRLPIAVFALATISYSLWLNRVAATRTTADPT